MVNDTTFELHTDNDPNLMPHRRRPSRMEVELRQLSERLERQQVASLLAGCEYANMHESELYDLNDQLVKKAFGRVRPIHLYIKKDTGYFGREWEPDAYLSSAEKDTDWFDDVISDLKGEEGEEGEEANMLMWEIDKLSTNPLEAISSWCAAYDKHCAWLDGQGEGQPGLAEWTAFHVSSLYLLCLFTPDNLYDRFNPLAAAIVLTDAFIKTCIAFSDFSLVYYKLHRWSDTKVEVVSRPMMLKNPFQDTETRQWKILSSDITDELYSVFKKHIQKNGFSINEENLKNMTETINEIKTEATIGTFFLPFICTKLFANIFYGESGNIVNENANEFQKYLEKQIYSYEEFNHIFDNHKRVILDDGVFGLDSHSHPVICFMLDIVSLIYHRELIDQKMEESAVMDQINANWLALYFYGTGRYFNDPNICSEYCEVKLPILMTKMFERKEDEWPGYFWIFLIMNHPDEMPVDGELLTVLLKDPKIDKVFKEVKNDLQDERWKSELVHNLFIHENWEDDHLIIIGNEQYSDQVSHINQMIDEVQILLDHMRGKDASSISVVRTLCAGEIIPQLLKKVFDYRSCLWVIDNYKEYLFEPFVNSSKLIRAKS